MYKKIQLKISDRVISEMQNTLIVCGIVGRPPAAPEQAIILILKAIEKDKSEITIELKADLKKKKAKKKSAKKAKRRK